MSAPETTPVLAPLLPRLRAERAIEAAAASAARPLEARGVELEIGLPDGARAFFGPNNPSVLMLDPETRDPAEMYPTEGRAALRLSPAAFDRMAGRIEASLDLSSVAPEIAACGSLTISTASNDAAAPIAQNGIVMMPTEVGHRDRAHGSRSAGRPAPTAGRRATRRRRPR